MVDAAVVYVQVSLASAAVWFGIGAAQIGGRSFRVSTGAAFIATSLLVGLYAFWDWLGWLFGTTEGVSLPPLSRIYLVAAALAFLYFAKWLVHGRRWYDALAALPLGFMALPFVVPALPYLGPLWGSSLVVQEAARWSLSPWPALFYLPLLYVLSLILAGMQFLRQGALLALEPLGRESWSTLGILGAAALMLALAILTNFPLLLQSPPYSATLVVPGAVLLLALRGEEANGVLQLFNLKQAFRGETLAVYLIYKSGDLLGAAISESERADDDIFVGTLDAFQSFFTHALPFFQGQQLRTATFGEIAVLIERGRDCYLMVMTTSKRLGLIREIMRRRLRRFEEENATALEDWTGMLDALEGTDIVLEGFVPEEATGDPPFAV